MGKGVKNRAMAQRTASENFSSSHLSSLSECLEQANVTVEWKTSPQMSMRPFFPLPHAYFPFTDQAKGEQLISSNSHKPMILLKLLYSRITSIGHLH